MEADGKKVEEKKKNKRGKRGKGSDKGRGERNTRRQVI